MDARRKPIHVSDWKVKGKRNPRTDTDRQWRKKSTAVIEPYCKGYFTEIGKSSCNVAFPLTKKSLSHYKAWKFQCTFSSFNPQSDPISIIILRASDKTMLKLAPLAWKDGFSHRGGANCLRESASSPVFTVLWLLTPLTHITCRKPISNCADWFKNAAARGLGISVLAASPGSLWRSSMKQALCSPSCTSFIPRNVHLFLIFILFSKSIPYL